MDAGVFTFEQQTIRSEALNHAVAIAVRHADEDSEVTVARAEAFRAFLAGGATSGATAGY